MMMNTNDIRHHQQPTSLIGVHHQSPQVLSIEQFLRAAKLIEQHKLLINQPTPPAVASADHSMLGMLDVSGGSLLAKLGEEYQERFLLHKMRSSSDAGLAPYGDMAPLVAVPAPNSTGSSRRSSPLSAAASPCSPSTLLMAQQHQQIQQQQQQRFCAGDAMTPTTSQAVAFAANNSNSCGRSSCGSRGSGHATTPPATASSRGGGSRGASRQSRAAHNELEKNRRANLRGHLEALKAALPPEVDTQRDTTLSLLTRARNHIRTVKEQRAQLLAKRTALLAEHLRLKSVQQKQQRQLQRQQQLDSFSSSSAAEPSGSGAAVVEDNGDDNNSKQNNHSPVPTMKMPMMPTTAAPLFFVVPPTTTMASPPMPTQPVATDAVGICLLAKKNNSSPSSMADRDLLEMQGLIPLLPQLYPYKHPSSTNATTKLIDNRLVDY